MILVMACSEGPPHVPSDVVTCTVCKAPCWLSKYSGASTIAAARATGDDRIVCSPCFHVLLNAMAPEPST